MYTLHVHCLYLISFNSMFQCIHGMKPVALWVYTTAMPLNVFVIVINYMHSACTVVRNIYARHGQHMWSDACDYARRQPLRILYNCMRVHLPLFSYLVHTLRASIHVVNMSFIKSVNFTLKNAANAIQRHQCMNDVMQSYYVITLFTQSFALSK